MSSGEERGGVGGFVVHSGSRGTGEEVGSDLVSQEPMDRLGGKFSGGGAGKGKETFHVT